MNIVHLIGNLGKEPEMRAVGDKSVTSFSLATKGYNDATDWHNINVWGKQAESCKKYLDKGSQVAVTGRIQYRSYEKDGATRYVTDIVADRVEFLSKVKRESVPGGQSFNSPMAPDVDAIPF